MKKYYIIKNKEKEGPFSISDLKSKKINSDTLVWHRELDDWVKAKEVKEILDIIDIEPPDIPSKKTIERRKKISEKKQKIEGTISVIEDDNFFTYEFANFGERLAAYLLDGLILSIPLVMLIVLCFAIPYGIVIWLLMYMVINWLYYTLSYSSEKQSTIGQSALGIKVLSINNGFKDEYMIVQKVGFGKANGKYWGIFITALIPLYIGWLMMLWTEKRQCLHDIISGVVVVRKKPIN